MIKENPDPENTPPQAPAQNPGEQSRSGLRSGWYYISAVARFEAKILWRSWLFRIFSLLILAILIFFNLFAILAIADGGWAGRYIPGNIVYLNFFLFTVPQVIIAAFLSADFLGRERKMDTTEVFYTRPMSNFQYVTGKTWGALQVFMGLNLVVLFLSLVISLIAPDVVFVLQPFLFYLFLYSLPSLVFILGFSFILMVLVRNQAVTFVLILGFAAIVLFYLKNMHYGTWDFIGFYLPVHYSGFSGFADFSAILIQRSIFFLLGVLGIFLTAYFLPRLPGHKRRSPLLLLSSVALFSGASFLIFHQISLGKKGGDIRHEIRIHEASLPQIPAANIEACHLEVQHSESTITCEATLELKIDAPSPVLLNLNPGFTIENVTLNQQPVEFTFRHGLLLIDEGYVAESDPVVQCRLNYHGAPDQRTIYPHVEESDHQLLNRLSPLVAGKKHAFVQSDYLLLTRESGWYPVVAWQNFRQQPAFTSYSLEFQSRNKELKPLSQGEASKNGSWTRFENDQPLNALTLIAGKYTVDSVTVDSIDYQMAIHEKNSLIKSNFDQIGDTLPSLIRDLKGQYERKLKLKYPFNRLKLVEVPVHFFTYFQPWASATDHLQPEFVLFPEYGAGNWFLDVKRTRDDFVKESENQGKDHDYEDIQSRVFVTLAGNAFLYPRWQVFQNGQEINRDLKNWSRLQIFPLYYNYAYQINEEGLPVFQIMLEEALRSKAQKRNGNFWSDNSAQYRGLLTLKENSLAHWLNRDAITDTIAALINLTGIQYFSEISAISESGDFVDEIQQPLSQLKFKPSTPGDWLNYMDVSRDLSHSYNDLLERENLPVFKFGTLKTIEFRNDGKTQYLVSLQVFNYGDSDGALDTRTTFLDLEENRSRSFSQWMYQNIESEQKDVQKLFLIPKNSEVRIDLVFHQLPREMKIFTGVAENLPPVYTFPLRDFSEKNQFTVDEGMHIADSIYHQEEKPGIYIVDNEDSGFVIESRDEIKTLKDWWLKHQRSQLNDYQNFNHWNPPPLWTPSLAEKFHGKYLRSAVLKNSGTGNDMVRWICQLNEAGSYEIQVHIPAQLHTPWKQRDMTGGFNYHIYHATGKEEVTSPDVKQNSGWISLGRFYFEEGEAMVELSDKSDFPYVVADAVKWIKR